MCWSPHARGPFCSSRGQFDPQDLASKHALRRKVILQNHFENSKSTRTQLQNSLEKVVKMRKLVTLWPNVGRGARSPSQWWTFALSLIYEPLMPPPTVSYRILYTSLKVTSCLSNILFKKNIPNILFHGKVI